MNEREIVHKYANEIHDIIRTGSVGDYTWTGLLYAFLDEVDKSRKFMTKITTYDGELVRDDAPVEEDSQRYDVEGYSEINGWFTTTANLTYEEAMRLKNEANTWRVRIVPVD